MASPTMTDFGNLSTVIMRGGSYKVNYQIKVVLKSEETSVLKSTEVSEERYLVSTTVVFFVKVLLLFFLLLFFHDGQDLLRPFILPKRSGRCMRN